MSLNHPLRGVVDHRSGAHPRARRAAAVSAAILLALLVLAPSALAWNGNLEIRKVNIGGPSTDTFGFKVEAGAYGQPNFTLVPATDYTGAPWTDKAKPDNPFTLVGAPSAAGPFTQTGASPNDALFTGLDSGGQTVAAPPAVRDWRRFRVTETTKPAGYTTSAACTIANTASGAGWDGLDQAWGAWTATPDHGWWGRRRGDDPALPPGHRRAGGPRTVDRRLHVHEHVPRRRRRRRRVARALRPDGRHHPGVHDARRAGDPERHAEGGRRLVSSARRDASPAPSRSSTCAAAGSCE